MVTKKLRKTSQTIILSGLLTLTIPSCFQPKQEALLVENRPQGLYEGRGVIPKADAATIAEMSRRYDEAYANLTSEQLESVESGRLVWNGWDFTIVPGFYRELDVRDRNDDQ